MKKFFNEFKQFAMKGNVLDMAIGIVLGSAFTAIVTSLVSDIIMPCITFLVGNENFSELKWVIREAKTAADGTVLSAEIAIGYGNLINVLINFLIIAFTLFLVVKGINTAKEKMSALKNAKKIEEEKIIEEIKAEAPPSKEELLLAEIRDLLKENKTQK